MSEENEEEIIEYGDPSIASANAPVPRWLTWSYLILPIVGILWWIFFWNGSAGVLDPNYWHELQKAANTTFPIQNVNAQ